MRKMFIADSSEEFCMILKEKLQNEYDIEFCCNGKVARDALLNSQPDLAILDLMLPEIDGLGILEALEENHLHFPKIVTSRFYSNYMLHVMERHQVDYAVLKPCSVDAIVQRAEELLTPNHLETVIFPTAESVVTAKMYHLGMPTNLAGFEQMRLGAVLLAENPGQSVTKELYPAIAAQSVMKTSAGSVERNIRTAIHAAWCQRNDDVWAQYFRVSANGEIPKPTNTQFLTRLADIISQQLKKRA